MIFSQTGTPVASAQIEHTQIYLPNLPGWHEHDPLEIWHAVKACIAAVMDEIPEVIKLEAIGITNQRETTIAWNSRTGVPYYNAIVWDDARTEDLVKGLIRSHGGNKDCLRGATGLPLATYFSGTKIRWLIENVKALQDDLLNDEERKFVRFGTVDTWLVWQLTGMPSSSSVDDDVKREGVQFESKFPAGNVGGRYLTDVTNASRTLFMDIESCEWSADLVYEVLSFPLFPVDTALPEILPSSYVYGHCGVNSGVHEGVIDIPVASILGDQQAALFGQAGFHVGEAKCTYGTGLFMMMNCGTKVVPSNHGLLSTVAYKISSKETVYALEGSVAFCGSTIQWLRDQLGIINDASESENYAKLVETNDGMYFVPAFAGLFAPYWRSDARGVIVGMTASHTKNHFCRAALEAIAYQAKELFDAMFKDSKIPLSSLKVDGGGTANSLLMQFQADMLNAPVVLPECPETTAMGAAFAAGLAVGVWTNLEEIREMWSVHKTWKSSMSNTDRKKYFGGWKKAVTRSFGWIGDDESGTSVASTKEVETSLKSILTVSIVSVALTTGAFFLFSVTRKR